MAYISPSPTTHVFPASSTVTDGNLSTTATGDDAAGTKNDGSEDKIMLFIIVATIPTILLLIFIAVVLARRAREKGTREPFFKIQVEYNDKPRRPRSSNSRLDLTINGMQIDVEYDANDKRASRLSSTSFIADPEQVRELHKLSQECKENLVRIHEMLERELEPDTSSEPPSPSHNSELACTNNRDSVYSSCSEIEKGSHEASEKEIKRSNSSTRGDAEIDLPFLGNDIGDFIDSVFNSNENEECLNITPVKPPKPTLLPKPSMKKAVPVVQQPKPAPRSKKQTPKQEKSPDTPNKHLSVVCTKHSVPKNRTRHAHESLKNGEKPTVVRRRPEVPKKTLGRDNCTFEKRGKPPIPKKPDGLVIKITKRTPSDESKKQTAVKTKRTSKISQCDDV